MASKMENNFLAVNKEYFGKGLKSIDLLLIAQIEEYARNDCLCYVTNKQFSEMFGESESTIKRSIEKLEEQGIIERSTTFNNDGSRASRIRTLTINKARVKMNHASTQISKGQNDPCLNKQGSNVDEARFKNEVSKVHNDPIKEKKKDNKKDNITREDDIKKNFDVFEEEPFETIFKPKQKAKTNKNIIHIDEAIDNARVFCAINNCDDMLDDMSHALSEAAIMGTAISKFDVTKIINQVYEFNTI